MSPLVSVIIPTYKNRGGLVSSIESVLTQTLSDVEIIVVDDNGLGSTEQLSTASIMQKYVSNPKIVYIPHEINKNGAAARTTGIKAANGDYIAFLDDDDCFLPEKLERQVAFLHDNPRYSCVYCQATRGGKLCSAKTLATGNLSKELLLGQTCLYTPTLMFTRQSIMSINGFDENFRRHQDYELMLRFFRKGYIIGAVNLPLTEIGCNQGENIPDCYKIEQLKEQFLGKFEPFISDIDNDVKGFKKKVYAHHYGAVFISYLKYRHFKDAFRILRKHFKESPRYFIMPLLRSIKNHI